MINVHVSDETSRLERVILGTAKGFGGTPPLEEAYDPKSKQHIIAGTYPKESDLVEEMDQFAEVLLKHGVIVHRPDVLQNTNQVFSRDIGFVIDDRFIKPNILKNRKEEINGIKTIVEQIPSNQLVVAPPEVRIEGGDLMPWNDHIFIGYSEKEDFDQYIVSRTNREGVEFIQSLFPDKKVMAIELNKSDDDPYNNALHLDCCFQPVGKDKAIIHKNGFKNVSDYEFLVNFFGQKNIVEINKEEMYEMMSNIFSIAPDVVVSEKGFTRLNKQLRDWGITVEEIKYSETAKMEGLLRCSTLPLKRV